MYLYQITILQSTGPTTYSTTVVARNLDLAQAQALIPRYLAPDTTVQISLHDAGPNVWLRPTDPSPQEQP